jgi:hypothetical protein
MAQATYRIVRLEQDRKTRHNFSTPLDLSIDAFKETRGLSFPVAAPARSRTRPMSAQLGRGIGELESNSSPSLLPQNSGATFDKHGGNQGGGL